MNRLLAAALVGLLALAFVPTSTSAPAPKAVNVYYDAFKDKFALDWKVVRSEPDHVSFKKVPGALVITTQRGSIHGKEKDDKLSEGMRAKNIHLLDIPFAKDVNWTATTCVSDFRPDTAYQQAGLIVYDGDDDYLKWGYEYDWQNGRGQRFFLVAETEGVPAHEAPATSESDLKKYWLRLTKRGDKYEYSWSSDGEKWVLGGERTWGNGQPKRVGIIAKNGGNKDAAEIDATFRFFELKSVGRK
jgi:regulation of enolase protein 1 (concanavalin A-like superfamily)